MTTRARHTIVLTSILLGACERDALEQADGDTPADGPTEADFPERTAEAYCAALFACDPVATCVVPDPIYASQTECAESERSLLEGAQVAAQAAGLTYDAACVEDTILGYASAACQSESQLISTDRSALDVCPPYHGTVPDGEGPCFEVVGSGLSDCGAGLLCSHGSDSCSSGSSDVCKCEQGFARKYGGDEVCVPVLDLGSVCVDSQGHSDGVCEPDADCVSEYDDEGYLIQGTCVARRPLGSPCASGSECVSLTCDDVCTPASPYLCEEYAAPRRWR